MKAVIDTNVIVDVLQNRQPWCEDGKTIFMAVATNQITGCITAKQAADIHFFSRKQFTGQENVDQKARDVLSKLLTLFELLDSLAIDSMNAFGISNNDYEDAMLIESASRSGADCIITRNTEHFQVSPIKVFTPEVFLREYPLTNSNLTE